MYDKKRCVCGGSKWVVNPHDSRVNVDGHGLIFQHFFGGCLACWFPPRNRMRCNHYHHHHHQQQQQHHVATMVSRLLRWVIILNPA